MSKAPDTSAKYPSKTGLQIGDEFDHDRYGKCTVIRVRRARNNKGILPYDSVTVLYGDGKSIILPLFSRPAGVRRSLEERGLSPFSDDWPGGVIPERYR